MGGEHVIDDHQFGMDVHRHPRFARWRVRCHQRAHVDFQARARLWDERAVLNRFNLFFEPDLAKLIVSSGITLGFTGFITHLAAAQCIGQTGQRDQGLLFEEFGQGRCLSIDLGSDLFNALQLGDFRNGVAAAQAFKHAMSVQRAWTYTVLTGIGDHKQVQVAMQARVTPFAGLVRRCFLDRLGQRWPTKVLVLDVDELGRVVDRLQVDLFDVALAVLRLGAHQLGQLPGGARRALQLWPHLDGLTRSEQVLTGLLAPGKGEVIVQVFQNRPADLAGNILAWRIATRAAIGCWLVSLGTVQRRVLVSVPVLVEHVVAHDKANSTVRQFIVDQHGFLMVRRGDGHSAHRR